MTDDITAAAVAGPWRAVLAIDGGWVSTLDEILRDNLDPAGFRLVIVRGSATPFDCYGQDRLPDGFDDGDWIVIELGFVGLVELRTRHAQAEAMAAGLNAAGAR